LMATREFYGEKEFLRLINLYKEKTLNLPAIRGIDRSDQNAFNVLYAKGAVLLHQLQIMIGAERFKELLKNIHRKKIKNTLDFMDELTSLTSEETSNKFSKLLDL
ncbi:MAG: M1 family metallopeptidase, partial [Clostridium sp.]|nr:M1 family metallopeptidase [Clostridium sp.]